MVSLDNSRVSVDPIDLDLRARAPDPFAKELTFPTDLQEDTFPSVLPQLPNTHRGEIALENSGKRALAASRKNPITVQLQEAPDGENAVAILSFPIRDQLPPNPDAALDVKRGLLKVIERTLADSSATLLQTDLSENRITLLGESIGELKQAVDGLLHDLAVEIFGTKRWPNRGAPKKTFQYQFSHTPSESLAELQEAVR